MVRPGIGLYGGIRNNGLKEVIQIKVPVLQDFIIDKNMQVGYNFTYKAKHKIRAATLSMGYADGLPRTLSKKRQNSFEIFSQERHALLSTLCCLCLHTSQIIVI